MTWVLLRGLTREARHWDGFTAQLAEQFPGEKIIALDLPGNGVCFKQASPSSVSGMVAFARQELSAQQVTGPFRLLAMSLGGMVATEWAQHYPADIDRLVLINTSMRPFSSFYQRLRPQAWWQLVVLASSLRSNPDDEDAERLIHRLTCNSRKALAADIALWQHIRGTAPVSSRNALRQLWAAAKFSSGPVAPNCPVLVLSSAADRLVSPQCSAQLAAAWHSAHHQHEWAGHDLPHDDGPWVCGRIAAWLSG